MDQSWTVSWEGAWGAGFQGTTGIASAAELDDVLARRDSGGNAEFTLARSGAAYPCLVLNVHDDRWYVHFFPEEFDPGAYLDGDAEASGSLLLPAGSNIEVLCSSLVDRATAQRATHEFLASGERPADLEWVEL